MDEINDYLQKKAAELDLGRGQQLTVIQEYLDGLYPGQCRAVSLNEGVLKITTPSASVANELRLRQVELLSAMGSLKVVSLQLLIGG